MAGSSIRDELRKKYNITEETKKNPDKVTSTAGSKTGSLSDKYRIKESNIDESFIEQFLSDADKFTSDTQSFYESMGYGNRDSVYNSYKKQADELRNRSKEIRQYFDANKNTIDADAYKSVLTALDAFDQITSTNKYNFYKKRNQLSKFDSEEAYQNAVRNHDYIEKYGRMGIGELQSALNGIEDGEEKDWVSSLLYYYKSDPTQRDVRQARYEENQKRVEELLTMPKTKETKAELQSLMVENRLYERGEGGWAYRKSDEYAAIEDRDDFAITSQKRDYANPTRDEIELADAMNDPSTWKWDDVNGVYRDAFGNELAVDDNNTYYNPKGQETQVKDKLGLYLSTSEDERVEAAMNQHSRDGIWKSVMQEGFGNAWEYLLEEEKGIYYALLYESQDKAYKFLDDMAVELTKRKTLDEMGKWTERYHNSGFVTKSVMNLETIPANVIGGVAGAIDDAVSYVKGEEINPYSYAHSGMHYSNTVRGETAKDIDYDYVNGEWVYNPTTIIPVVNFTVGDLYQSGMSMADSLAAQAVGGRMGGAFLASSAAENEAYRLYQQGASKKQIAIGFTAVGIAEMVFESLSIGNLKRIKNMSSAARGQFFKALLVQGGVEMTEEMATEVANIMSNAFIMGTQSDWAKAMDDNDGKVWNTVKQKGLETLHAGLSGFFSGAGSGGVVSAPNAIATVAENRNAKKTYSGVQNELVGEALDIDPNNAYAQRMQNKLDNGKNLTGKQLNRLVQQNEQAIKAQDISAIQKATEARLIELGETENVSALAEVLAKQASGVELTAAEQQLVDNSKYGNKVASQLDAKKIQDGWQGTEWTGKIGTERINAQEYNRLLEAAQVNQGEQKIVGGNFTSQATSAAQNTQTSTAVNDRQVTGKLTSKESLQVAEKSTATEKAGAKAVTLEEASKKYGDQAQAMIHTYREGQDVKKFDQAYRLAYNWGQSGVSESYVNRLLNEDAQLEGSIRTIAGVIRYLTKGQVLNAYAAGKDAASFSANKLDSENKAKNTKNTERKEGTVRGDGVTVKDLSESLNDTQQMAYRYLVDVAKVTGINIVLYRSQAGADGKFKGAQGMYNRNDPGTLYIDLNAGLYNVKDVNDLHKYAMLRTFTHEFVHFIEYHNPVQYDEFRKVVFDTMESKGVDVHGRIIDKQKHGLTYEEASREVIADSMADVLPDSNFVQDLAQNHKNIFRWLIDKLKEFVNNLKQYYKTIGGSYYEGATALKEQVGDTVKYMDSIVKLFDQAAVQAVENYQQTAGTEAQKNTTEDGGVDEEYDIQLSAREEDAFKPYAKEINSVINQAIAGKGHISGKVQVKEIMPVGPRLAAMVAASSGNAIDISRKSIALNSGEIWHEYDRHTGVGDEISRGQIAFTKRQFQNAVKCIISPDFVETIFSSANNPTQNQSFAYVKKTVQGSYVVVEAVGGKRSPYIYPVMILQFSKAKWNKMMAEGKTLGELLLENDPKKLKALDIEQNKKSRVSAAQFASYEAIANTLRSSQLDTNVSQSDPVVNNESAEALDTEVDEYKDSHKDVQYQQRDADYMDAANSGDVNTAKKILDAYAIEQGFETDEDGEPDLLFHGTDSFGFTKIDTSKSDDKATFWATPNAGVAGSYYANSNYRVRQIGKEKTAPKGQRLAAYSSMEQVVKAAQPLSSELGIDLSKAKYVKEDTVMKKARKSMQKAVAASEAVLNGDFGAEIKKIAKNIVDASKQGTYNSWANAVNQARWQQYEETTGVNFATLDLDSNFNPEKSDISQVTQVDPDVFKMMYYVGDVLNDLDVDTLGKLNGEELDKNDIIDSYNQLVAEKGIYGFYHKQNNPFVYDCQDAKWNKIPVPAEAKDYFSNDVVTTRQLAEWAFKNGYDAIKLDNVVDFGGYALKEAKAPATVWAFKNPESQIKSADPVTYDDSGNVIPLSKRFDTNNNDIRYQQRTNTLTDRDVLAVAASEVDTGEWTAGEKEALGIFAKRLKALEDLQTQRTEQGRIYREQQFGPGGDRQAAAEALNRMHVLDEQISRAAAEVLDVENKEVLRKVLKKARSVVEQQDREHFQEVMRRKIDRMHNAADIKKYRERIRRDVDELTDWVVRPDNKSAVKHIPDALKNTVIPFLNSIDFTSKRALRGGEATQKDKAFAERLSKLAKAMKDTVGIDDMYANYNDLPPDFVDKLTSLAATANQLLAENSGEHIINRMTAEDLRTLSEVVRTLKKHIKEMNQFHVNAMFKHVYDAGNNSISFMEKMEPAKNTGAVSQFLLWQQMRPAYAFERFGDGGVAIYDGLRRGQATMAFNTNKILEFSEKAYTTAEVKKWDKDVKTIDLGDGKTIKMRVSQIMSLYELNKREQARWHLYGDGLRVSTFQDGNKKIAHSGDKVSEEDVNKIISKLTPRQKEVADQLQQFMQKQGGEWGNHVTLARFGEKQFGEENYFPINSDGRHLEVNADEKPGASALYALLNMGFTKQTQEKAKNRLIVYSIFDVFANHMASMAQYNAFALPVIDALKWFNYKQVSVDENGKQTIAGSVRDQMDRVYGTPVEKAGSSGKKGYAQNFVINILKAFNGTEAQGTTYDGLGMKALSHYNRSQVAYNLRVVLQQPMAITRAAQLIDYRSILKGLKLSPAAIKRNVAEMREHSGIAAWKALGFYDVNISRGLTSLIKRDETGIDKVIEFGMKGAELADTFTWGSMWSACKEEVIRKQKMKPGDKGFFEAVTNLFEDVVYKTQVVDSVLTKNEFMRDKGFFAKAIGSFMSEPTTTASMLVDAYDKYHMDRQRGMTPQEAWKKNSKKIIRTTYVYGVGAVLLAAVQAVADAFRDDDDYEDWLEKWKEAFSGNLVDELIPLNKLPIVSDFYDLGKELLSVFGVNTYGNPPQSVFMQWYDSLVKGVDIIYGKITGEEDRYTWYGGAYKLLQAASGIAGLPMAGATREIVTAWNNVVGAMAPSLKVKTYDPGDLKNIQYAYQDGYLTEEEAIAELLDKGLVDTENEAYFKIQGWESGEGYSRYDAIYDAVRNGGDISEAMQELTSHGYAEKDVLTKVKSEIGSWYKDGQITKQQTIDMLTKYMDMDSEEITATVNKWSSKVVTGIAFEDIKNEYLEGSITADRAIEMYVRYGGYSKEKATETVTKWGAEKETGVAYNDIEEAFLNGEITEKEAKNMYIQYGGLTEEKAKEKVIVMSFGKDHPGMEDISYSAVENYNTYCKASGVSAQIYYDAWKHKNSLSGSVKEPMMEYIHRLRLTAKQKDSLYYAFGWKESTIDDAPWH